MGVELSIARCPHCGAGFELGVGAPAELVTCASCGAESERARLVVMVKVPVRQAPPPKPTVQRPKVDPPQPLEVATRDGVLTVRWRSAPRDKYLLWLGWGGLMALMLMLGKALHQDWPPLLGVLGLLVLAVYLGIAGSMNRTEIEASSARLRVKIGPVPSFGGSAHSAAELSQLYVTETYTQDKDDNPVASYALKARLKTGAHVTLIDGLTSESHALYLEQVIERHLGIVDASVPHEMMR